MRAGMVFAIAAATVALVIGEVAEAKRLGGGKTFGRQSGNVTQRDALPPQAPRNAAAPQQAQPAAAAPTAQAGQAAAGNRWLAPVAGLAAGLGLAALASYLGFGEELASLMLMLLLAAGAFIVVRLLLARRGGPARPAMQTAYANSGVGGEASVRYAPLPEQARGGALAPPAPVVQPPSTAVAPATWRIPSGFDVDGFVRNAKVQFVRLQTAYDAGDLDDLREFTSPEMFAELRLQLQERQGASNRTDVVQLDAELLGIESGSADHMASVRFSGLIRENESAPAQPFDEVWNLSKPADGRSGWVLAGIQQLD